MSITRVFRVQIHASLRAEFEPKFNHLSKGIVERAAGCIRLTVLRPTKWTPNEYAMISEWESEEDLTAFAGENWNQSVIPAGMEVYAESHSVSHYHSWV
jgi:heme-degrading monooxygenase HmoA